MDIMDKINDLREQKAGLLEQANSLAEQGKLEDLAKITEQMQGINTSISALEELAKASKERAEPVHGGGEEGGGAPPPAEDKAPTPFRSLGEQLKAIVNFRRTGTFDKRLQIVNEAMGSQESVGADGGFLIQTDFAGRILESIYERSPLLGLYDRYTVSRNADSMRWTAANETDISESVFGGVRMYWASEGETVPSSKPSFREIKLDLEKMMGIGYATNEMLEDAAFMTQFYSTAFSMAGDQLLTAATVSGDGVGKPTGWLNGPATIAVAKETSQAAGTITGANVLAMLSRTLPRNRSRYVWVMHPDLEEQLPTLTLTNGDTNSFLWTPEGGLGNFDAPRVLGRRVIFDDNCAPVGQPGDINLIDPLQYILLSKGSARQDWSIHVQFLTDQSCFRMVFRCNGAPKVNSTVKIKNSDKPRSAFITLAART